MIVTAIATATAVAGLTTLDRVAERIEPIPEIPAFELPERDPGDPYTLLVLGSDFRPGFPDERSDTTILARLDPELGVLSTLAFPRDLKVFIPGVGTDRLNAAYESGGPKLTRETLEELTGVEIDHVVDVGFKGFADGVNAIGCAYVDVDREYFVPPGAGFAEIDINAGYQRLCGLKALQFVRFRKSDNDVVRGARQQLFLAEARKRVSFNSLVLGGKGSKLVDAFVDNTRSTIGDGGELRRIATSLFDLRDETPNQVELEVELGETFVEATPTQIDDAVDELFGRDPDTIGDSSPTGSGGGSGGNGNGAGSGPGSGGSSKSGKKKSRKAVAKAELVAADPQFERYARTAARRLKIPAFYPSELTPASRFERDSRTYEYETEDGDRAVAYKLVISRPHPNAIREYYGISGTSWKNPPILQRPSETRKVGGREMLLFYAGDRLKTVGWRKDGNAYWISNSLLQTLSEAEMLAIAASIRRA